MEARREGESSTSASSSSSPLSRRRAEGMSAWRQRLPGQRTPPDPNVELPNAADLTYGWHQRDSSSSSETDSNDQDAFDEDEDQDERQDNFADALQHHAIEDDAIEDDAITRPAANTRNVSGTRSGVQPDSTLQRLPFAKWWAGEEQVNPGSSHTKASGDNDDEQTAQTNQQADQAGVEDSFVCRICFDGPGSMGDGGESLGKLIAPCRCRGTMKFVHQRCLTRWRVTSRRESSVMQCDQCGAPYRFRKSRFVGLATNKPLLVLVSCYLFISLVWIVGFTAEMTMRHMDETSTATNERKMQASSSDTSRWWPFRRNAAESTSSSSHSPSGSRIYQFIDLDRNADNDYDADYYDYRYDYRYAYSEPAAYYTLIKAAVKYVGSGQAIQHLFANDDDESEDGLLQDPSADHSAATARQGWWSILKDNWMYGKGGIWEGQRPAGDEELDKSAGENNDNVSPLPLPDGSTYDSKEEGKDSFLPAEQPAQGHMSSVEKKRERYDALGARDLHGDEKPMRPLGRTRTRTQERRDQRRSDADQQMSSKWLERITLQFSLGASLVGISSFLTLLLGISTWGPFHLNLGLGRGFARMARRRGRGGGGGGGGGGSNEGEALVAVFLLFLVIVGIIRALFAVYGLTTYVSKRLLTRVEDIIVDWGNEGEEDHQQQQQQQQQQQGHDARPDVHPEAVQVRQGQWVPRWLVPTALFRRRVQRQQQ